MSESSSSEHWQQNKMDCGEDEEAAEAEEKEGGGGGGKSTLKYSSCVPRTIGRV